MSPSSASQKKFIRNPKVHYRAQNSPLLLPILRQINVVHILPNDFVKIHSDIMLPVIPVSFLVGYFSQFFLTKALCTSLSPLKCDMPHTPHTYWFDHRLIFGDSPMVRTVILEAPHRTVFSSLILPCPYAKYHSEHLPLNCYRPVSVYFSQ
jgi:hypothetical protein